MQRRDFVRAASIAILAGGVRSVSADGPNADVFSSSLIAAPDDPSRWPAFREDLAKWREKTRKQLNYDDTLYRRKDFAWVPSSFACWNSTPGGVG